MIITLAYADDHIIVRQGITESLQATGKFKTIVQASSGEQLMERLSKGLLVPDICIIDFQMPLMKSFQTLKLINCHYPSLKTLVFSQFVDAFSILKIYQEGANGAFSKEWDLAELVWALQEIREKGFYFSNKLSATLQSAIKNSKIGIPRLSAHEQEYLYLLCKSTKNCDIASALHVSVRTVEYYRDSLLRKLRIDTTTGLILFAIRTGIFFPDDRISNNKSKEGRSTK